jgi:hypothetical protein
VTPAGPAAAWSFASEPVLAGRGARFRVRHGAAAVTFGEALALLDTSAAFRTALGETIAASPCVALRWETPPVTQATLAREFEFVLVDDPFLETPPEPAVFAAWFDEAPAQALALAVPNLGRTARLVVPRGVADDAAYVHLKAFLRHAPREQVHALWQCVARTAREELSDAPLWVSTAGGGVSWLHVRIERVPKYYVYRPYARA